MIIGLSQQHIQCIIGMYPEERVQKQSLFIDLKIRLHLSSDSQSDAIEETVDYVLLAQLCAQVALNDYFLIETFAKEIVKECLTRFPISWAWVKIQKPSAIPEACAFVEWECHKK